MPTTPDDLPDVPDDLAELFAPDLAPDERILWAGRPRKWRVARAGCSQAAGGAFFAGFAAFWFTAAFAMTRLSGAADKDTMAFWFPFFGVPFFLVGLGLMSGPLWAVRDAGRSAFAVTDRRLLARRPVSGGAIAVQALPAGRIGEADRTEYANGVGTLSFAVKGDGDFAGPDPFEFTAVDDALGVLRLVRRELMKEATP